MLNGIDIYIYIVKKYTVFITPKNFCFINRSNFFLFCFFFKWGGGVELINKSPKQL